MQETTLAQQLADLRRQLTQLYIEGEDLEAKLAKNKQDRLAVRNLLAGVEFTLDGIRKEAGKKVAAAEAVPEA